MSRLVSSYPYLVVNVGTSTITESCVRLKFEPWGQDRLCSYCWLQLRAAKRLEIQYIGYVELDIELCGNLIQGCGVLVV